MKKLVVDTSSIVDFFKFYPFDKNHSKTIFNKLKEFIITKIKNKEIIVIDKVFEEIKVGSWNSEVRDFKRDIKEFVVITHHLIVEVDNLSTKYYVAENEKFYDKDKNRIQTALDNYLNSHADLFLVAYCNDLKKQKQTPILISDESKNQDNKLVQKIPTICSNGNEDIECQIVPHFLFEIYKDELKFSLN